LHASRSLGFLCTNAAFLGAALPGGFNVTDEITVERFAASLNSKMLACRELHHLWVPWTVEVVHAGQGKRARVGGYVRVMRCRQCKSERRQILDSRGHVVANGYRYTDGYLASNVARGVDRSRDAFRLEAVVRFVENQQGAVVHSDGTNAPAPLLKAV
jgi:hypothetical protein